MALKGKSERAPDPIIERAVSVFAELDAQAKARGETLKALPSTTETVGTRVPKGEKSRIRAVFARHGLTLSEGIKRGIYELMTRLEEGKK